MSRLAIIFRETLTVEELRDVTNLMNAAAEADGAHPFSEEVLLRLRQQAQHVLAYSEAQLSGYAFVDTNSQPHKMELAVHPTFRRQGIGSALLEKVIEQYGEVQLWAHGSNANSALLAHHSGFSNIRSVLQMRRSLLTHIADVPFEQSLKVRPFNAETDTEEWLELNRLVFAEHPEQGRWQQPDLDLRLQQPWFDEEGFIVALRGEHIVGFNWTKVHHIGADESLGELYILGVHPNFQEQGLGKALTVAGLKHLREIGMTTALLYVDAENTSALNLYKSIGFVEWDRDTLFARKN